MIARAEIALPSYVNEILAGLSSVSKSLPCKLFYDQIGSALFEQITRLPEYYLTRTELAILEGNADEIIKTAGSPISVVELGAGTATKTRTLLRSVARRQIRVKYFPVDISPSALAEAQRGVREQFPGALVRPVIADLSHGFGFLRDISGPKLVLYLGSSIGNFDGNESTELLRKLRGELSSGDALLLGTDTVKSEEILLPAYDDRQGVTREFNKNILRRINRELGGNFDLDAFCHRVEWNAACSRMEIYLESCCEQQVLLRWTGTVIRFLQGERIHTENSYKYTDDMVCRMLARAGFQHERTWLDGQKWFALHLARVLN
ncbi:MAG: L-histidine N(alpha)-methyltransferase [Acidobacteria bacterium]|nr:L-histidine N(alpha)-methyltransferase [Acidobacteriota bacterium]